MFRWVALPKNNLFAEKGWSFPWFSGKMTSLCNGVIYTLFINTSLEATMNNEINSTVYWGYFNHITFICNSPTNTSHTDAVYPL